MPSLPRTNYTVLFLYLPCRKKISPPSNVAGTKDVVKFSTILIFLLIFPSTFINSSMIHTYTCTSSYLAVRLMSSFVAICNSRALSFVTNFSGSWLSWKDAQSTGFTQSASFENYSHLWRGEHSSQPRPRAERRGVAVEWVGGLNRAREGGRGDHELSLVDDIKVLSQLTVDFGLTLLFSVQCDCCW